MKATNKFITVCTLLFALALSFSINAAEFNQVDTIAIKSDKMGREIKNVVIMPACYNDPDLQEEQYAVLYLLHGYGGTYKDWVTKKPELKDLATEHSVIIVCPDGQDSWYLNSPIDPEMQYETYMTEELIEYIDNHYRTIADPKFRAITGLSMGGHGAMSLALKHPEVYWQCGSMSGGLDITPFPKSWKIKLRLGEYDDNKELWKEHSVQGIVETLESSNQRIIIDCGIDDFFYKVNTTLHNTLLEKKIAHDFISRPGRHTWDFWCNSIDFQLLFFSKGFYQAAQQQEK